MTTALTFRHAREEDVDRLIDISFASYPDPRTTEERRRTLLASPMGSFAEDLYVALLGERVVGRAFLFPLEAFFGGRRVKVGGVASVAVAPEARGQGVATGLMKCLHTASDIRGDAVTMLYPFAQKFYGRMGYGSSTPYARLELDPRAVPDSWRALGRGRARAATGADRAAIAGVYLRAAADESGWLVRSEATWDRGFARERRTIVVLPGAGEALDGYVAFEMVQDDDEIRAEVVELVAVDDGARRALWGVLAGLRDEVTEIQAIVRADDPIALVAQDATRRGANELDPIGVLASGPMFRIEDPSRAIEARGYHADAAFDLVVREPSEGDDVVLSVVIEGGRAKVAAAQGGAAIATTRAGLAAVLYGAVGLQDAVRLGWADVDARLLPRAHAALALPPVLPIDPF